MQTDFEIDLTASTDEIIATINQLPTGNTQLILRGFDNDLTKIKLVADFINTTENISSIKMCPKEVWNFKEQSYEDHPGQGHFEILFSTLMTNDSVRAMSITHCVLSAVTLEKIAQILKTQANKQKTPSLNTIKISFCILEDIRGFAITLAEHENFLEYLDLSENNLEDRDAIILTGMACVQTRLKAINLVCNKITDVGAHALHDLSLLTDTKVNLESNRLSSYVLWQCKKAFAQSSILFTTQEWQYLTTIMPNSYFKLLPKEVVKYMADFVYSEQLTLNRFFRSPYLPIEIMQDTIMEQKSAEEDLQNFMPR